jgi:hypothetical protein
LLSGAGGIYLIQILNDSKAAKSTMVAAAATVVDRIRNLESEKEELEERSVNE